jgi:hypothetical protein
MWLRKATQDVDKPAEGRKTKKTRFAEPKGRTGAEI